MLKDTAYIKFLAPIRGTAKVIFDGKTDLKVGRHLETTGFALGKSELRAIRVLRIQNH